MEPLRNGGASTGLYVRCNNNLTMVSLTDTNGTTSSTVQGSLETKNTLMIMLSCILIRRDFSDTLFGQPIVPMPECKSEDVIVQGHEAEKKLYDVIVNFWLLRINGESQS